MPFSRGITGFGSRGQEAFQGSNHHEEATSFASGGTIQSSPSRCHFLNGQAPRTFFGQTSTATSDDGGYSGSHGYSHGHHQQWLPGCHYPQGHMGKTGNAN